MKSNIISIDMNSSMALLTHRIIKPTAEQRVFFCGDVHGNFTQLQQQLQIINFDYDSDILVITGDIIDRGYENAEMIQFVTSTPRIYSVLGNHETMFLEAQHDELVRSIYTSSKMGGNWIEKYTIDELKKMAALIRSNLPIAITIDLGHSKIGVIHAASPSDWQNVMFSGPESYEHYLWSRDQFVNAINGTPQDNIRNIDAVVHGHVCSELAFGGNQIWIDTNWSEGRLTLIESTQVLKTLK